MPEQATRSDDARAARLDTVKEHLAAAGGALDDLDRSAEDQRKAHAVLPFAE